MLEFITGEGYILQVLVETGGWDAAAGWPRPTKHAVEVSECFDLLLKGERVPRSGPGGSRGSWTSPGWTDKTSAALGR